MKNQQSQPRLLILTEGATDPMKAKTATCLVRYRESDVVALLDSTQAGKTAAELLGVGRSVPIVGSFKEAPEANTLLIGIAPSGGKIPPAWRPLLQAAVRRGMDVISGLHDFLSDDPELLAASREHGTRLVDVRQNDERDVADGEGFRPGCMRVLTVGQDCSVGKMVVALEVARGLQKLGHSAKFVATGQTGIMIEGEGCPVDCVVSDFVNGAVEKLVRAHEAHDFLVIEGQGSLAHPRYSPVTLGLLHGSRPQGMILCYEFGRDHVHGMTRVGLRPLDQLREAYEVAAGLIEPSRVIGIAVNTRCASEAAAAAECRRLNEEFNLPACDVLRHGPEKLVQAVLALRSTLASE